MHAMEMFFMIRPHQLLADTCITKTATISVNDLLAYVRQ